jgi:hypothetical protein
MKKYDFFFTNYLVCPKICAAKKFVIPGQEEHPLILALRRLRQENFEFKASLGFLARSCQRRRRRRRRKRRRREK